MYAVWICCVSMCGCCVDAHAVCTYMFVGKCACVYIPVCIDKCTLVQPLGSVDKFAQEGSTSYHCEKLNKITTVNKVNRQGNLGYSW